MKKIASIIASVLLCALLISAIAVNVFASTTHNTFSISVYTGSYSHTLPADSKNNSSDMMILIETGNNSRYYVRTVACDDTGDIDSEYGDHTITSMINCTFYNNSIVDYCTVLKGTMYSVPNQVYYTDDYAAFGILSPGNPGTVTGRWSADTDVQYATPTY